MRSITVKAPATVANLGSGFDLMGLAIHQTADVVTVKERSDNLVILQEIINPWRNPAAGLDDGVEGDVVISGVEVEGITHRERRRGGFSDNEVPGIIRHRHPGGVEVGNRVGMGLAGEIVGVNQGRAAVEVILDELTAAGLRTIETSIDDQGSSKPYMLRAVCMAHR